MLIPDFTLEKIIHKSQSTTAVQSNFSMGLACSCQLWLYFIFKLGVGGGEAYTRWRKIPKWNRTKAYGDNSPINHPASALVAGKDSGELLQNSHSVAAAVAAVEQAAQRQGWGEGCGLEKGSATADGETVPMDPACPLAGAALNCFLPPRCGETLGPSREWPEGGPKKWGWQRYRINVKRVSPQFWLAEWINFALEM